MFDSVATSAHAHSFSPAATGAARPVFFRHNMRASTGQRQPLNDDQIRKVAPSVFAQEPWSGMTDKYLFVPTVDLVHAMRAEGFQVVQAMQGRTRIEGKGEFTKHMLRFEVPGAEAVHSSKPELVLINSHDGTSSYRLMMGVFRMICSNGLLSAELTHDLAFRHSKKLKDEIIEGTGTLVREVPGVSAQIDRLAGLTLNDDERRAYASAAHALRWDGHAPVEAPRLLDTRRRADDGRDAWTTLNVVQENIMRGGLLGRTSTNRRTTTRAVSGVTENVRLNHALSVLMAELANQRAAT